MNLHGIAAPYVAAVNPLITVIIQPSTGSAIGPDGTRVPSFGPAVTMLGQIQSLTFRDLVQMQGLNVEGERRALYLTGDWNAVVRAEKKGGDLVTLPDGSQWLTAMVLENWSDKSGWVKLAITRMNT